MNRSLRRRPIVLAALLAAVGVLGSKGIPQAAGGGASPASSSRLGRTLGSPCKFSAGSAAYGAKGNTASLVANGYVSVSTPSVYITPFSVSVGVWMDDYLAKLASDMPSLVLSYFEHANCIFAEGLNATTNTGVHKMSLRIAGNRIHYYKQTTPPIPGTNGGLWLQQVHQDWAKAIQALGAAAPKVNVLFSAAPYVETTVKGATVNVAWQNQGGASNGIGQGQALAGVAPGWFRDGGAKPFAEDWWGVIAAHELGHALGAGHLTIKFATLCCAGFDYSSSEKGGIESYKFSVAQQTWDEIVADNKRTTDGYADPYATVPNPVTNKIWNFDQVHGFLTPYNFADAIIWRYTGKPCKGDSCRGWQALDMNQNTVAIAATGDALYQLHGDGSIWRYTGTPCNSSSCPGWKRLDNNANTKTIAAAGDALYQLHSDGSIWRYTGTPCNSSSCPGWQLLDNNPKTKAIVAATTLYQLHST